MRIALDRHRARDLATGGVFIDGCALGLNSDCTLVIGELEIAGRIVFVDARGAGIELVGFSAAMKQQLVAMQPPEDTIDEPEDDVLAGMKDDVQREHAVTLQQKLRGLTLAEAVKKASSGDPTERIILERMYGKTVWEPVLRNPRLTVPEVTRIARMGMLPRPMMEIIVGNGTWLQIPEIRRALLSNPRLGPDQVMRVLRLMPKPELKLAGASPAYPHSVRDAAKRLFKEGTK